MEKLHLLCNAHIDPVWLWRCNEGIAEALSTFRVAADFCEKYDGFVFNHNEALLYEWVEEHEPQLFERIKRLVSEGKWVIMGGWYLQPDCVMTSGESLFSQIELGRKYFKEKFGIVPTAAMGLDAFGHTRGLVQILTKTGFDSYFFIRPHKYFSGDFIWEGFDGSHIFAHGVCDGAYSSLKGSALHKIEKYIENNSDKDIGLCLWGIGNHGGGPSQIDLENINEFIKRSDMQIVHSSLEEYVREIPKDGLPTVSQSLCPAMIGCYTSMARIKQAHRKLENNIAVTEKIMSYANMANGIDFEQEEFDKARKALAFCQFHDILPGSCVKEVEEDALRTMGYGEEILDKLYARSFFNLCKGQKKAKDGELPIMVFNPHPYPVEGEFDVELCLQNQNWNEDEWTYATVVDQDGNELPTQTAKPSCTFNLDWMKKVSFKATVAPSSVTRFDCRLTVKKKADVIKPTYDDEQITVTNDRMTVRINRKTGLIDSYEVDGVSLLRESGILDVYRDNEDPWGMKVESFDEYEESFRLMSDDEANEFVGYTDEKISNVRVIEDGDVYIQVQAFFAYKATTAVVEYSIPKMGTYVDVNILMYSNVPNKLIKYRFDTAFEGEPIGEAPFGCEKMFCDGRESVFQKWCGIKNGNKQLYVLNRGTYGGSFTENSIRLSLLRTPIYAAHPIKQRQIAPHDRFVKHIDMGERQFSFRIIATDDVCTQAQIYNEAPRLLSFFPSGDGELKGSAVEISDTAILLTSLKKDGDTYTMHLYNSSDTEKDVHVSLDLINKSIDVSLGAHEVKIICV